MIFKQVAGQQVPITPYVMSRLVVYGQVSLLETCIIQGGDATLPSSGIILGNTNLRIMVKADWPGSPLDLTYVRQTSPASSLFHQRVNRA